jgi:hypothetical protein
VSVPNIAKMANMFPRWGGLIINQRNNKTEARKRDREPDAALRQPPVALEKQGVAVLSTSRPVANIMIWPRLPLIIVAGQATTVVILS